MDLRDKENISRISPLSLKGSNYHHLWLRNRELGQKSAPGMTDRMHKEMYSFIRPIARWESSMSSKVAVPGCIFNLEFSPDGSIMAAACEKRSVQLFDPISQTHFHSIDNAHNDCVNCVRFLDSRMFATCSDDKTVALWDTRNLKTRIRVLNGHENWVKNVEYSKDDKLLVTSGFDGQIFTWDINSYSPTERGFLYKRVFQTNGLMRMNLLPDASKMVICTTGGYIMVVHNLNLQTLQSDLQGFKPNMYRLMQISETTIPVAAKHTHLFSRRRDRNRVEFITDFPPKDEAETISSLQIHPQGWCALTRNVTSDERSEWTCVHDIQDSSNTDSDSEKEDECSAQAATSHDSDRTNGASSSSPSNPEPFHMFAPEVNTSPSSDLWEALITIHESRDRSNVLVTLPPHPNHNEFHNHIRVIRTSSGLEEQFMYEEEVNSSDANSSSNSNDSSPFSPSSSPYTPGSAAAHSDEGEPSEGSSSYASHGNALFIITPWNGRNSRGQRKTKFQNQIPPNHQVHRNTNRLTHFIEETNAGKGFIKELGFSQDGRIICSPYSFGIRLLAFNDSCSELSTCVNDKPVQLHELGTSTIHSDIVLCSKFSSRHCLLASGCQSGHIIWYQPVL